MTGQTFHERLRPSVAIWIAAVVVGAGLGLAAIPFGLEWAIPVAVAAIGAAIAAVVAATPSVSVRDGELWAGSAHIPLALLGDSCEISAAKRTAALGPELDARAYVCFRSWVPTAVKVDVIDPEDPTPYWLISTRRPGDLIAALSDQAAHSEHTG